MPEATATASVGSRPRRASDRSRPQSLGAFPLLALVAAGGLIMVALGNNAARENADGGALLFWAGLALIYGPIAFRLFSVSASRRERICLAVLLGVALFMVKVLYSPLRHPPFDELASWRQTYELLATGRPFSSNPIASGFPGFPGLETVTAAIAQLAGLSIFHAGIVVIGMARAGLMLALFLLFERISVSSRGAGVGVAIYACNPSFLYFDSQFAHESLALLLGACLLLVVVEWSSPPRLNPRTALGFVAAIVLLVLALTITHHMTSYALAAFLVLWALLAMPRGAPWTINRPRGRPSVRTLARNPVFPAILMCSATAVWFVFVGGDDTIDELGNVFTGAIDSVTRLIFGGSGPKTLFQGGGDHNPALAKAFAFASVIPLLALIPFGLWQTWRTRRPLWQALAIVALLYPVTLGLRLTLSGTETSQRASEFVFVGLAFFAAVLVAKAPWPKRPLKKFAAGAALAVLATVIFCGAFIVAQLPTTRQPGPFLVGADARSVSPQGLAAARFTAEHLPTESRTFADRSNGTLLGSYGLLDPVLGNIHGIPVARVLFSKEFDDVNRTVIVDDEIEYLVVDQRLSRELPSLGFYLEPEEPRAFTRKQPLDPQSLDKFGVDTGLDRIYTNGPIAIYATSRLRPR